MEAGMKVMSLIFIELQNESITLAIVSEMGEITLTHNVNLG